MARQWLWNYLKNARVHPEGMLQAGGHARAGVQGGHVGIVSAHEVRCQLERVVWGWEAGVVSRERS